MTSYVVFTSTNVSIMANKCILSFSEREGSWWDFRHSVRYCVSEAAKGLVSSSSSS